MQDWGIAMERGKARTRLPWSVSTFAFLANRIAGMAVALYLLTHILVISTAARNRAGFDHLMQSLHSPFWLAMELLLMLAVIFHGINGIRLILIEAGVEVRKQRSLFWCAAGATAVVFAVGALIYVPIIMRRL